jgi:OFA family oxalate/formate antiporter-like MFS transporter
MCVSVLIASFMKSWWGFVIFYGVFFPMGIGICYWVPIMCGWEWFPEHKGLVSGLIVAGYGFGSFIFGFITSAICNPDDAKVHVDDGSGDTDKLFPREVADRVPEMFRYCLILWAALGLLAVFGVSRNPEYVRKEKIRLRNEMLKQ